MNPPNNDNAFIFIGTYTWSAYLDAFADLNNEKHPDADAAIDNAYFLPASRALLCFKMDLNTGKLTRVELKDNDYAEAEAGQGGLPTAASPASFRGKLVSPSYIAPFRQGKRTFIACVEEVECLEEQNMFVDSSLAARADPKHASFQNDLGTGGGVSLLEVTRNNGSDGAKDTDISSLTLNHVWRYPSHGTSPCHILAYDLPAQLATPQPDSLPSTGTSTTTLLIVSNYTDGRLSWYRLSPTAPFPAVTSHASHHHSGPLGPNQERQDGPHAHSCIAVPPYAVTDLVSHLDASFLSCDLGLDMLVRYSVFPGTRYLQPRSSIKLSPGSGPRHAVFHPKLPILYVANELDSSVSVLSSIHSDSASEIQRCSTLPDARGNLRTQNLGDPIDSISDPRRQNRTSTVADIHIRGDKLFVSNRGHDSIFWCKLDPRGRLMAPVVLEPQQHSPEENSPHSDSQHTHNNTNNNNHPPTNNNNTKKEYGWIPTHGRDPRGFTVLSHFLVILNQTTVTEDGKRAPGNLVVWDLLAEREVQRVEGLGLPVCVKGVEWDL